MTIKKSDIHQLITMAIAEDISKGDITSQAIFSDTQVSDAVIISKEDGIICGLECVAHVYGEIDPRISIEFCKSDGDSIKTGETLVALHGNTIGLLTGERITLNFLQRLCGISTKTDSLCQLLKGTEIKILDTRKTLPGFRLLDKYAVKAGGGENHRIGLYDMIMIKDNHIHAAGSILSAVDMVRKAYGSRYTIEVETTTVLEAEEAAQCEVDIIMLDNMARKDMVDSITAINGRSKIEISGNVDHNRINEIKDLPIDYISVGALTHSVHRLLIYPCGLLIRFDVSCRWFFYDDHTDDTVYRFLDFFLSPFYHSAHTHRYSFFCCITCDIDHFPMPYIYLSVS